MKDVEMKQYKKAFVSRRHGAKKQQQSKSIGANKQQRTFQLKGKAQVKHWRRFRKEGRPANQ